MHVGHAPGAWFHGPTVPCPLLLPWYGKRGLATPTPLRVQETFMRPLQPDIKEDCLLGLHGGSGGKSGRPRRRKDLRERIIKITTKVNLIDMGRGKGELG